MAQNLQPAATAIVAAIGGRANIELLTHCVTRLRFVLKDESKVDETALKNVDLVKGCFKAGGQFQVVIGPGLVDKLFDVVQQQTGLQQADKEELKKVEESKENFLQRGLKIFSDVFIPLLPAIVGAGILLGVGNILTAAGIFGPKALVVTYPQIKGLADMILMVANTAFTYIPVLVAWSATKRFGGNPMLGILLGLVLINAELLTGTQMASVISGAVKPEYWNIFGLNIMKLGYQNSVLPPLVASWVLVFLEKWLKKVVPDVLQLIVVAPVAILITSFLTFLVIGPVMNQIATWITDGVMALFNASPILAGLLFGLLWEPLVVTGMHYAFIAVNIQLIASTQQSSMLAIITIVCVAEAGADFAMAMLARNKKQKSIAVSAGTSALLGVTEPSMFGVTIPARYPFICSIATAGLAGAMIMVFKEYAVSLGPSGPLSFVIIPAQFWPWHYLIMAGAFVISLGATYAYRRVLARRTVTEEDSIPAEEQI